MERMDRRSFISAAAAAGIVAASATSALAQEAATPGDDAAPGADAPAGEDAAPAAAAGPNSGPVEYASEIVEQTPVPGYMCSEDWLGSAPVISEADIVETIETDIVICGAGHAGTQAALVAAQEGAKVVLIEAQSEDMYSCFGEDICTYNSQFLTDRGFGGYDLGQVSAEYVRRGAGRVSPELLRQYVEQSGPMLDNVVAQIPDTSTVLDFDNNQCQVQIAYGMPDSSYYPIERGGLWGWASTIQTMGHNETGAVNGREPVSSLTAIEMYCQNAARDLGCEIRFGTKACVLVQNDAGDVTGVIAKGPDGYIRLNAAKAVCVTTGDFAGNADMVINLLDDINELALRGGATRDQLCGMGRDGSGHKMLCWAGGNIESHPRPTQNSNGGMPGPWGNTPFLLLNANGKRFMNEGMSNYAAAQVARQPHGIVGNVTDAKWYTQVQNAGLDHGAPNFGQGGVNLGFMDRLQQQMGEAVGSGADGYSVGAVAIIREDMQMTATVYCGETLEELLGYMGYEGEALQNALDQISAYNEMCAAGVDTQYGKDPLLMQAIDEAPFYGSTLENTGVMTTGLVTLTGMVTDDSYNVLSHDYTTPIKGLYVAGNTLGHRYGPAYSAPSAGNSIGMAMTHGYCMGKVVAAL